MPFKAPNQSASAQKILSPVVISVQAQLFTVSKSFVELNSDIFAAMNEYVCSSLSLMEKNTNKNEEDSAPDTVKPGRLILLLPVFLRALHFPQLCKEGED